MGNPATVIDQYRRYVQDGRLEISEVMASELSELLISKKGKTLTESGHLVTALRDLAKIQEMRSKMKKKRIASSKRRTKCEKWSNLIMFLLGLLVSAAGMLPLVSALDWNDPQAHPMAGGAYGPDMGSILLPVGLIIFCLWIITTSTQLHPRDRAYPMAAAEPEAHCERGNGGRPPPSPPGAAAAGLQAAGGRVPRFRQLHGHGDRAVGV